MSEPFEGRFEAEIREIEELSPVFLFGTVSGGCTVESDGSWSCTGEVKEET
jgi:hypothetical protein